MQDDDARRPCDGGVRQCAANVKRRAAAGVEGGCSAPRGLSAPRKGVNVRKQRGDQAVTLNAARDVYLAADREDRHSRVGGKTGRGVVAVAAGTWEF